MLLRHQSYYSSLAAFAILILQSIDAFESTLWDGRGTKTNACFRTNHKVKRHTLCFTGHSPISSISRLGLNKQAQDDSNLIDVDDMEYRNVATKLLSNFMNEKDSPQQISTERGTNVIDTIDFNAPKFNKVVDIETMATILDYELIQSEWFVTGKVNPIYFANNFQFQDPDVKLNGVEEYARGVNKLFDQTCSRAEIIKTDVNTEKNDVMAITVQWRLSGKVKIGIGLTIKPYIVYTDFLLDDKGLIVFQEDRFDIPQWDILVSALFPFLIGIITSKPAPPIVPRSVVKPAILS
jgi:hypothetical protein